MEANFSKREEIKGANKMRKKINNFNVSIAEQLTRQTQDSCRIAKHSISMKISLINKNNGFNNYFFCDRLTPQNSLRPAKYRDTLLILLFITKIA